MTETQEAQVVYRRTKTGDWVAYGPAGTVKVGTVTLAKKNGETKTETVVKLGRVFQANGRDMVYGYLERAAAPSLTGRSSRPRQQSVFCDECGERNDPGTRCWETGAMHGPFASRRSTWCDGNGELIH